MKAIEIGPKEVNYENGNLYAEFSDRTYVFTPNEALTDKGDVQECANLFVCGIMMMSYTHQIEEKMSEFGYIGTITINEKL